MTEFRGTLRFVDLGTGQWVLETVRGARHPLLGEVPQGLRDAPVIVEGTLVESYGFGLGADDAIEIRGVREAR